MLQFEDIGVDDSRLRRPRPALEQPVEAVGVVHMVFAPVGRGAREEMQGVVCVRGGAGDGGASVGP